MTMKQERTPGPWRVTESISDWPACIRYKIVDAGGMRVFYAIEANANHIVHCVNNFDELVGALESVMVGGNHLGLIIGSDHPPDTASYDEARTHYYDSGDRGERQHDMYEAWCCWKTIMGARAALKLAKGTP